MNDSQDSENAIQILDVQKGVYLLKMKGHEEIVSNLAWNPTSDSEQVASGSDDDTVPIWDAKQGKNVRTLDEHIDAVQTVAWTKDGTTLVSGSSDSTIKIWDIGTGKCIQTLKDHTNIVDCIAFQ